jgi:hypothetical protein
MDNMPKPFHEIRERLLGAGIAPRHVRRYVAELTDHLADLKAEEQRAGRSPEDANFAALLRLGKPEDLAKAMLEQRQFQAWCVRAPWAVFGLAPILLLNAAQLVVARILLSGVPKSMRNSAATPFVHHEWFFVCFGIGLIIYFSAPVLIGWAIGLIAIRQRSKIIWPTIGLALVAFLAGTMGLHAEALGMSIVSPRVYGYVYGLLNAVAIFSLAALPYLIWRLQKFHVLD